jgi:hypothetical protein
MGLAVVYEPPRLPSNVPAVPDVVERCKLSI